MAFTLAVIQQRLSMWLEAEEMIAKGQSYTMDNRKLERANLAEVRDQIKFWQMEEQKAIRIE
ncbi:MAG TPA: DUF6148 family protein, partial [Rummeliibacillus sp.]|nr:DUF6148 family protein [Rummeliibacillus sp.]